MLQTVDAVTLGMLFFLCVLFIILFFYISKKKNKKQLDKIFLIIFSLLTISMATSILQIIFTHKYDINPIYFDYVAYIGVVFLPVAFFIMALIYSRTRIDFNKYYLALLIIPLFSLIALWTNDWHHLFYKVYSINLFETVNGALFWVYNIYTYILFGVSIFILLKYSIKNSGFFSKPAIFILLGILIPLVANILGGFKIIPMTVYITPITLGFTIIFFSLAFFRFNILKNNPIALQTIVDRISDSYVILNDDYEITDYNETFVKTFKIRNPQVLRGKHFAYFLKEIGLQEKIPEFGSRFEKVDISKRVARLEIDVNKIHRTFNVEITSIISSGEFLGILVLFKDITQHINDMQSLKNNQDLLVEHERLASLGQMIGGIAHNLKTPIFSVAGGLEGLSDLIKEYDESIDDDNVTNQDMHDIAKDMNEWIVKLKDHVAYMSDVITTVKGQAVNMSEEQHILFPISELFQHVNILMQHEVKEKLAELEIKNKVPDIVKIDGNINSLVQVINNLISNAIEAYGDSAKKKVELYSEFNNKEVVISVRDYGPGLPEEVQHKLFKEMITTKGKNGTGLGLFMSYSNIKAHFNGTITYETEPNKGTTFHIIIPIK